METLMDESSSGVTAASVGRQVLSLAGDALCIAATALRLAVIPSATSNNEDITEKKISTPVLMRLCANNSTHTECSSLSGLQEISLAEVAHHDHVSDCWIVVYDLVYDVTKFLFEHPGGDDVIMEYAGRDASLAFRSVNHGPAALRALERCLVGKLPAKERIFGSKINNKANIA